MPGFGPNAARFANPSCSVAGSDDVLGGGGALAGPPAVVLCSGAFALSATSSAGTLASTCRAARTFYQAINIAINTFQSRISYQFAPRGDF